MTSRRNLPTARDKLLFTPGPLTTSLSVKQAMLHDAGSWHFEFNAKVKWIREKILEIAGLSREAGWETVPLLGSGGNGLPRFVCEQMYRGRARLFVCHLPAGSVVGLRGMRAQSQPRPARSVQGIGKERPVSLYPAHAFHSCVRASPARARAGR